MDIFWFVYALWFLDVICAHYVLVRQYRSPVARIGLFWSLVIAYTIAPALAWALFLAFIPIAILSISGFLLLAALSFGLFCIVFFAILLALQPTMRESRMYLTSIGYWIALAGVAYVYFFAPLLPGRLQFEWVMLGVSVSLPFILLLSVWRRITIAKATLRFVPIIVACVAVFLFLALYFLRIHQGYYDAKTDPYVGSWATYTDSRQGFSIKYPSSLTPRKETNFESDNITGFYSPTDEHVPFLLVQVAMAHAVIDPKADAPLFSSCETRSASGVVNKQEGRTPDGIRTERFLDKNADGVVFAYRFTARIGDVCYLIWAVDPGYRLNMDDIQRILDSFSIIAVG